MSEQLHLCREKIGFFKNGNKIEAASVWRSEIFRQKNHNLQLLQWADYYAKKVRGSRSQAITYAKKGDYALRDILLIMQQ